MESLLSKYRTVALVLVLVLLHSALLTVFFDNKVHIATDKEKPSIKYAVKIQHEGLREGNSFHNFEPCANVLAFN